MTFEVPEKPVEKDVISATETSTTTVTKELRFKEVEPGLPESHKETIEIIGQKQPQEVELLVKVPKTTAETTVVSVETEEAKSQPQRIEVEIQETFMTQKPKQTEIVIPKLETTTKEIVVKTAVEPTQIPRPVEEIVEETRQTIEMITEEKPQEVKPVETHKEEITFDIEGKPPVEQEIVFQVETLPLSPVEPVSVETETPAPEQPEEVTERETITRKPVPDQETQAPEYETEISERETIEFVKMPEEKMDVEIEEVPVAPNITETIEIETVSKTLVTKQIVPEVQETHKEEITLDVKGKPVEQVQLIVQMQPDEKQALLSQQIEEVEQVTEQVTETFSVPEVEETPKTEEPMETEERPEIDIQMTIDVSEKEVTEIEEITSTEQTEISEDTTVAVPLVSEAYKEEITIDVQDKPSAEVTTIIQVPKEKEVPEIQEVSTSEKTEITEQTTVTVPMVSELQREEVNVDIQEQPSEEVTMIIHAPKESEVPKIEEVSTTEKTEVTEQTTVVVPMVSELQREEISIDVLEQPSEEVTMTVQIPKESEIPEIQEISTIEETEVTEKTTVTVPIVSELQREEISFDIEERPSEEVTMTIQIPKESEVPEVQEISTVEEAEVTEKTTVTVPIVSELQREEISIDVHEQPTEEVTMTIQLPKESEVPEVQEISTVEETEVTEKTRVTVPIVSELQREEISFDIQEQPSEEVTLTVQIPKESEVPEVQEISTVKETEVTEKTTITVPIVSELQREEMSLDIQEQPSEEVTMTIQIAKDSEVPEMQEISTTERTEVTEQTIVAVPLVSETQKKEVFVDIEEIPSEEVTMVIQVPKDSEVPEIEEVSATEKTEVTEKTTVTVPVLSETQTKEVTIEVQDKPSEEVTMTIQVPEEREVSEIQEVSTTEKTEVTETTTVTLPIVSDTQKQEIYLDVQEKPSEQIEMIVEVPKEKEVPVKKEITQTETTITTTMITEVPETEEKFKEEITLVTQEKQPEAVQFEIELKPEDAPEITEVTETDVTETVTQIIQLPQTEETHKDEINIDVTKKPETVQMEIVVPTETVTETVIKTTETIEETSVKPEETEIHKEEIQFDIVKKPDDIQEIEIKIPMEEKSKSPKETSPKEQVLLLAPTTEEIFDTLDLVEEGIPQFVWGLTSLKVMDGEEAKFFCEVKAEPSPVISWFHDDKPIAENQDFRLVSFLYALCSAEWGGLVHL